MDVAAWRRSFSVALGADKSGVLAQIARHGIPLREPAELSCKGRGVCPSCNTRRMAETAAYLTDHVLPHLPVRQWVLSVPKRLRYFLQNDPKALNAALRIFLRVIERSLRQHCPGAAEIGKIHIGACAFIHRFGSSLNTHVHFHICAIDGVFEMVSDDIILECWERQSFCTHLHSGMAPHRHSRPN